MTLLTCVVLATMVPVILQASPQKVERVERLEWCDDLQAWRLLQRSQTRIEGSPTVFAEETTELWRRPKPGAPPELPPRWPLGVVPE